MTSRARCDVLLDVARGFYVVAVAAAAVVSGGFDFLLLLSAMAAVAVRWVPLTRADQVAVVTALLVTGLSSGFRLYGLFGLYDKLVHGFFFVLVTPALYRLAVRSDLAVPNGPRGAAAPTAALTLVMVAVALAGGAVWEIVEWVSDALAGTTFQVGNTDTMGDLVADATGGLVASQLWGRAEREDQCPHVLPHRRAIALDAVEPVHRPLELAHSGRPEDQRPAHTEQERCHSSQAGGPLGLIHRLLQRLPNGTRRSRHRNGLHGPAETAVAESGEDRHQGDHSLQAEKCGHEGQ